MADPIQRAERPTFQRGGSSLSRSGSSLQRRDAPDLNSMFDDGDDDPTAGVEATDDLQADLDNGMSAALREIIERKRATQERFRTATDPEFFFCVVFQSRDQKDEFLRLIQWDDMGDKYLSGLEVARRLEIPISITPIEPLRIRGKPSRFSAADILKKGGE